MAANQRQRIMRSYRTMTPSKFHATNQRIDKALTGNEKIEEIISAANPTLLQNYHTASAKHDAVYHQALYGSKLDIAEREVLTSQLIIDLDEIALLLEAAAPRNPDILLTSGFELAKERRSSPRPPAVVTATEGTTAEHHE